MRVLVTRAAADGARTAAALERLGHEAVLAPVIMIARLPAAWPNNRPKALVATSHNAFGPDVPADWLWALPVFAVGQRTAEAARAAGFKDVRIGTGSGEGLVPLVVFTLPRPGPLLHLAGRERKPGLEAALVAAGFKVDTVETYAAEPTGRWPADVCDAFRASRIDAALHYSRRSAKLALTMARTHDLLDAFLNLRHLCLSADAAEPLIAAKALSVGIADTPDEGSLLALLQNLRI